MVLRDGDYMTEIVDFIDSLLGNGYTADQLRFMLIRRGYSKSAIERGFKVSEQKKTRTNEAKLRITPKVVVVESEKEEEKSKSPGFFHKIKKLLTVKPRTHKPQYSEDGTVSIDENGNLVRS
ncbi:hypothetical protein ACFLZZ_03440 [Nanoarchaeota archaeon]